MIDLIIDHQKKQIKDTIRKLTVFGFWKRTRIKYILENTFGLETNFEPFYDSILNGNFILKPIEEGERIRKWLTDESLTAINFFNLGHEASIYFLGCNIEGDPEESKHIQRIGDEEAIKELMGFVNETIPVINHINIQKHESIEKIYVLLLFLLSEFSLITGHNNSHLHDGNIEKAIESYYEIHSTIISKAYQYIGYWTARVEDMCRNKKSVSTKSKTVEKNKKIITQLLEENNFNVDRQLEFKAMQAIDRGQRTVQNLIKKIIAEMKEDST